MLKLPAQFESLEKVRLFVAQFAEQAGFSPDQVYAIQMAVDEGFTNIIEHAFGGECCEPIGCSCEFEQEELVITLRDCGEPFNPGDIPEPDLESALEERTPGGLGLYLMRKLMDEVEFTFQSTADDDINCNVLRMVKRKEKKP